MDKRKPSNVLVSVLIPILLISSFLLASCGGAKKDEIDEDFDITEEVLTLGETLTLDKTSQAASAPVIISGLTEEQCKDGHITVEVGNQFAPSYLDTEGNLVASVPLFFDIETGWSNPPAEPVSLKLYCDEQIFAAKTGILSVEPLEKSPDTINNVLGNFLRAFDSFEQAALLGEDSDSIETALITSTTSATKELIQTKINEIAELNSLDDDASILLLSAIYNQHGYVEKFEKFATLMQELHDASVSALPAAPPSKLQVSSDASGRGLTARATTTTPQPVILFDNRLALSMQKYVILKEFVDTFVHDTVVQFQLASTILGMLPAGQAAGGIQIAITFLELTLSKMVLSSMPAELSSIELTINDTSLDNGQKTVSEAYVIAKNKPSGTTINDMTTTFVAIASGIALARGQNTLMADVVNSFIVLFNQAMSTYLTAHPNSDFSYDMSVNSLIPEMTFRARVRTPKFYKMGPIAAQNIVQAIPSELEWQADLVNSGDVEVYLMPNPNADARLITRYLGTDYVGGAFGDSSLLSNKVKLKINYEVDFKVTANNCIEPPEKASLDIQVNRLLPAGGVNGIPDLVVEYDVMNGYSTWYDGVTDASGKFSTEITALDNVDEILIDVTITDPADAGIIHTTSLNVKVMADCNPQFKPLTEAEYIPDKTTGFLRSFVSNTYDVDGNLIKRDATTYDSYGPIHSGHTTLTYDDRGFRVSGTFWSSTDSYWSYTYETDHMGNVTRVNSTRYRTSDNFILNGPNIGGLTTYTYDSDDRMIEQISPQGYSTTYTYDSEGRLVEKYCCDDRWTYEYDANGFLIRESRFFLGDLLYYYIYTNRGDGAALTKQQFDSPGDKLITTTYYTY